ncbi:hypothetical protein WICMUC_000353 [Wickerhamomyces mucosus]|uniref:Uncharacterized protein n=1 Tax=Wickerhamomyces mucosus TaxID=1378264 RepID=A0A9P8PYB9_9ASCO|nr:hypothetical protein WICMUC_000353 [Wickerhamomyces mucosus]
MAIHCDVVVDLVAPQLAVLEVEVEVVVAEAEEIDSRIAVVGPVERKAVAAVENAENLMKTDILDCTRELVMIV